MADSPITGLSAVTAPASTDVTVIVNGGTTKKVTIANLVANSNPASLTISGLTAGRVTYAGTAGLLSDDSGFTYNSVTHALTTTTFVGVLTGIASGNTLVTIVPNTAPSAGQILAGNAGGTAYAPVSMSGDATLASTGAITLASTVSAGGPTGSATVAPIITYDAKGRLTAVSSATITPAVGSITGLGTGIAAALAINTGSAGAPVLFNGAGGTPSSIVLTNATGTAASLTAGTASAVAVGGITGLGTGVATALVVNVGTAGAFVVNGGALGTPSSGTLTNATGLPAAGVVGTAAVLGANTFTDTQTVTKNQNASTTIAINNSDTTNSTSRVSLIMTNGTSVAQIISINGSGTLVGSTSSDPTNIIAGGATKIAIATTGTVTFTSGLTNAAGTPGSLCYNTSTFEMTKNNALTCTVSAREYKSDNPITPLTDGLDVLMRMNPRQFSYNDDSERLRWGFIADELQEVDARLADNFDERGHAKSIDLSAITASAVLSIQELVDKVEILEKRILILSESHGTSH